MKARNIRAAVGVAAVWGLVVGCGVAPRVFIPALCIILALFIVAGMSFMLWIMFGGSFCDD